MTSTIIPPTVPSANAAPPAVTSKRVGKPVKTGAVKKSRPNVQGPKAPVVTDTAATSLPVTPPSSVDASKKPSGKNDTAAAAESSTDDEEDDVPKDVGEFLLQLKEKATKLQGAVRVLGNGLKDAGKMYSKEQRAKPRRRKHAEQKDKADEPTFAVKPPLQEFLGLKPDEKIGRTAAHKAISAYIREHNLYDQSDKRLIIPDDKLSKLFGPPRFITTKEKGEGYSNLNVRRYIKDYFIDASPADPAAPSVPSPV